jgi:hypothetical protein
VPCKPLDDILNDHGIGEIHYESIYTQGEEPKILRSLDPSRMIHAITVRCNYASDLPGLLASSRNKFVLAASHHHDLFLIHRDSPYRSRRTALWWAAFKLRAERRLKKLGLPVNRP